MQVFLKKCLFKKPLAMQKVLTVYALQVATFFLIFTVQCSSTPNIEWETHEAPDFTIDHPKEWSVEVMQNGIIQVKGNDAEAILWPYYVDKPLDPGQAGTQLRALLRKTMPEYPWGKVAEESKEAVRLWAKSSSGTTAVAFLTWINGKEGSFCTLFSCASGSDTFSAKEEIFSRIFSSFRPGSRQGTPQSKPGSTVSYKRYQDPSERAFDLEYPTNWKIEGALYRAAPTDVRVHVRMVSPDERITIFLGDKDLPYFTEPNAMLEWTGFREGSWYSPGYGNNMMVKQYTPGVDFAAQYASQIAGGTPEFLDREDRPELARQIMGLQETSYYGINQRMDAGNVAFQGSSDRGRFFGYVFANTLKVETNSNGIWHVEQLYGYLASPEKDKEARAILAKVIQSFHVNPEWAQMQSNITGNVSKIVTQTNSYISGIINETYSNRSAAQDRSNRNFDDYVRGVERLVDENGNEYEVKSGSNYYWIDQFQQSIGTNIYQNPDIQRFRALVRVE